MMNTYATKCEIQNGICGEIGRQDLIHFIVLLEFQDKGKTSFLIDRAFLYMNECLVYYCWNHF